MNQLWAPWRSNYVKNPKKRKSCVFCTLPRRNRDRTSYIVKRNQSAFAVLNIYPYNTGHVMVAPFQHRKDLNRLSRETRLDLLDLVCECQTALQKTLKPHGFNIGMNLGGSAGAGYGDHLHIHIVPRWTGDTNFMPILTDTKIISVSLKELYQALRKVIR